MDLLTNAIESIRVGVEDYEKGSHGRLLAAVRGLHAGILLLYKEALRRLSPAGSNEVLIKAKVVPKINAQGNVDFVGDGRKTVDVQQITERFGQLGVVTDWKRFGRIAKTRNDIEHYYPEADKKALQSLVSDAFLLVRDFIATQLKEDPRGLLGDETWQAMLAVSEVYRAERSESENALAAIEWDSAVLAEGVKDLTCDLCGGNLLRPLGDAKNYRDDMALQCRACGTTVDAWNFVPQAVASTLGWERSLSEREGSDAPYTTCPVCGREAYAMDERRCALCGEEAEHTCARCGTQIIAEELVLSPYCGWCDHMMGKDD